MPLIRILPDGSQQAAIIAFQKTGLKPCKSYISGFVAAKRPLYTAITRVTANHQRKGTVEFVTPSFARISDSDPSEHPAYSRQLMDIRNFISTPRVRSTDDEQSVQVSRPPTDAEPLPAERAAPTTGPATAAPPADLDDDEEPF